MLKEEMPQNEVRRNNPLMAIFHGGTQQVFFISPEDLPADDLWEVVPKENATKAGEGIFMGKAMSSSRVFHWDGKQYSSIWTSD